MRRDYVRSGRRKHGASGNLDTKIGRIKPSPEYTAWVEMNRRCLNPKYKDWFRYGGRGITICARWQGSEGFAHFLLDMGPKPSPEHSLDRYPDKNGNYEPSNCRWATKAEQSQNRRESSQSGKLEAHEPDQIRWLASLKYKQKEIAAFFGISAASVSLIVNNRIWIVPQ